MDDKTLKQYFDMLTAAWKLLRTFKNTNTDADRMRLKHAGEALLEKYNNCKFMNDLICAVCNELCRRAGIDEKWNI